MCLKRERISYGDLSPSLGERGWCIMRRSDAETAAFVKVQDAELGLADTRGIL